jgi:Predicted hydrolases or acyltransferases (alpha/beta hydrolase superfamily)
MHVESKRTNNDGVWIHYLDSAASTSLVPVIICPGLSETAEEYTDLIEYLSPRRCVVLSFRGRGQSDTPASGYNLVDHVTDLESVVQDADLNRFHLFSYSRGVSYALGFAEKHPSQVVSLIVQDYPAEHKKMPEGWASEYINHYLVPFSRQRNIRPDAVWGIQRESEQVYFDFRLNKKLLVLKGMLEGNLLSDEAVEAYRRISSDVMVKGFGRSGHDIRNTEKELLYRTIGEFLNLS